MLEWDPVKRVTPEEAKRHSWITQPDGGSQECNALRTSAQQHELKYKVQEVSGKCQGHDGQIRAVGATSEARASRGPLTEAGNVQSSLNHGDKSASKPTTAGALANKATKFS